MDDLASAPWLQRLLVASLLAGLVVLAFEVLKPFIVPVIWAVILAHVTWPVYRRLLAVVKRRRAVAALLMTVGVTLAIVLPAIWLVALIRTELVAAYNAFAAQLARESSCRTVFELPWIGPWLEGLLARIAQDPGALNADCAAGSSARRRTRRGGRRRRPQCRQAVHRDAGASFVYRDGESFAVQVVRVLERSLGQRVHGYALAISGTVRAVVYGLLAAAVAQGTIAGLGYWVAGLNAPIALGALTMLAALIPFMTPVVWVGASLWLVVSGHTAAGAGLFLWGLLAISWIDNVVRPLVISNATRIPFLLVLFGVLGGVGAFGLVGLFVGPVILAVLMAVWREWIAEALGGLTAGWSCECTITDAHCAAAGASILPGSSAACGGAQSAAAPGALESRDLLPRWSPVAVRRGSALSTFVAGDRRTRGRDHMPTCKTRAGARARWEGQWPPMPNGERRAPPA